MKQSHWGSPRTFDTTSRQRAWAGSLFLLLSIYTLQTVAFASDRSSGAPARAGRENAAPSARPADVVPAPEVWLCTGKGVLDLLAPEAQWPFVREHLSGIQFYIDMIARATPEQLQQLVRLVRQQGYQVSVECGGTLDFAPMDETNGEASARIELAKLDKFYAAGGRADFLNLDGPVRRLMHPQNRRDGRHFDSVEKAADELVDYLNLVRKAHPEIRFFLLTNFPNWGYRGAVSYHARGPQRQDYGDYDTVVRTVLRKLQAADITLAGVTVDNPHDYLVGEHFSVNLRNPRTVDWLGRVRAYEDFARAQGLQFNLIVNSERGGHESDEAFCAETLKMVEAYRQAGGRPTRWFVQSWYAHPTEIVPESSPHSLTSLVKTLMGAVTSSTPVRTRPEAPAVRIVEHVSYGREAPQAQMLNAYLVQRDTPTAAIIQILSGGWNSAPPQRANIEPFKPYLDAGISVIVAAHRPIGPDIHWPAPGDDIARAIQYVRARAGEWGIDPNRIAAKGRSSGGHLALMAGFGPDRARPASSDPVERQSSRPNCIVAGAAPTDLVQQMSEILKDSDRETSLWTTITALVGGTPGAIARDELLAKLKPLSPIEYVTRASPPVFLTNQGPADAFWPGDARLQWDVHTPITSLILERRLKELQVPYELVISPEGGRGDTTLLRRELAFLTKYLHLAAVEPTTRGREARDTARAGENRSRASRQPSGSSDQIVLQPQPGTMTVTAKVPGLNNQVFSLGVPETIGCREAMLLNFPEASIQWAGPDPQGAVSCSWGPGGRIQYSVRMVPARDYVDVEMTVRNQTEFLWHEVFAFNCLNPTGAPDFKDWTLERTYMSSQGKPLCLARTQRVRGHVPTVGFYLPNRVQAGQESVFVRGFGATSPDRTDGSWIVTLSQPAGAYLAAAVVEAAFLFDNLDRCCIHAAAGFGDLGPGQTGTTVSRFYLAKGTLDDFRKRWAADRPDLASRQKTVSPAPARSQWTAAAGQAAGPRRPTRQRDESRGQTDQTQRYRLGAKFEPPAGRVVHGMGQWEQYNAKLLPLLPAELRPASKLIFLTIGDTPRGWRPEGIRRLMQRYDQEGLIPHLDIAPRGNQPSHAALATLADPLFGIDDKVASASQFDGRIHDLAGIVKEFGKPVIVRIGGEFNGRWNGYHPYAYPKAFRKIVTMFRAAGADNAAFVWCYAPAAPGDFDERNDAGEYKWFPGDDVIDWYAIDWFNKDDFTGPLTGGRPGTNTLTPHGRSRKFLDMAVAHKKPVMIAESAPCRYDLSDPAQAEAAWREWFEPYFAILAERSEIKWFHLISYDWTRASYFAETGWKNNDLTTSPALLERLTAELRKPQYLHAGDKALLKDYTQ